MNTKTMREPDFWFLSLSAPKTLILTLDDDEDEDDDDSRIRFRFQARKGHCNYSKLYRKNNRWLLRSSSLALFFLLFFASRFCGSHKYSAEKTTLTITGFQSQWVHGFCVKRERLVVLLLQSCVFCFSSWSTRCDPSSNIFIGCCDLSEWFIGQNTSARNQGGDGLSVRGL